jgi:hypothetical protein
VDEAQARGDVPALERRLLKLGELRALNIRGVEFRAVRRGGLAPFQ